MGDVGGIGVLLAHTPTGLVSVKDQLGSVRGDLLQERLMLWVGNVFEIGSGPVGLWAHKRQTP